jgi:hypothetical protein
MELLKTTNEYKVDTEEQAVDLIESAKAKSKGIVTYKTTYKTTKKTGEEWYVVQITEKFDA